MQSDNVEIIPDMVIRASSFSELLDCPERWRAKYILGMSMPSGAAALIGTAVHRGAEIFDTRRMLGVEASTEEATEMATEVIDEPNMEVNWDGFRPAQAKDIAAKLTLAYCNDISPLFTFRKVEFKFNYLDIQAKNGLTIRFTGKTDREYEGEYQGGISTGIADLKSGKALVKADGSVNVKVSAAQLGQYELLKLMASGTTNTPHLLPAKIIALPTAGKFRPRVVDVDSPHRLLIGTEDRKGLIDIAADMLKHDIWYGNTRSMLCSDKYCPNFKKCIWQISESDNSGDLSS